jgi:hypothetical protein
VPFVDEAFELADDVRVRLGRVVRGLDAFEERQIAGERTGVEEREEELGVVDLETRQLVGLANLMADLQPGVPQRVQQRAQKRLFLRTDRAAEERE